MKTKFYTVVTENLGGEDDYYNGPYTIRHRTPAIASLEYALHLFDRDAFYNDAIWIEDQDGIVIQADRRDDGTIDEIPF